MLFVLFFVFFCFFKMPLNDPKYQQNSAGLTSMKTMRESILLAQLVSHFQLLSSEIQSHFNCKCFCPQRDLRSVGILHKMSPTEGVGSANSACTYKVQFKF